VGSNPAARSIKEMQMCEWAGPKEICPHVNRASAVFAGNHLEFIRQYSAAHNMEIVQDYSSHLGNKITNRDGRGP
jgi:hypothetical protein